MMLLKSVLEVALISFLNTTIFPESLYSMSLNSVVAKSRTSRYPLIYWLMGKNCSLTSRKFMGGINELNQKRIMGQH